MTTCTRNTCKCDLQESESNARLIAAAPDLLKACIGLCSDELTGEQFWARLEFARYAIAKARGEND